MDKLLLLATRTGFLSLVQAGNAWHESTRGLGGHEVTSLVAREGVILAGTTDGIFRSDDLGKTWREASTGLKDRRVRWMAFHPEVSDLEFAGTEPANIYVSHDGAATWRECPEVPLLRDQHRWMLPYSPRAGCVRGFAFHGDRAYAAVEVGGALISGDRGETWRLADGSDGNPDLEGPPEPLIYPDVHSINVHPRKASRGSQLAWTEDKGIRDDLRREPDLIDAPTGGGFYRSGDGGKTWKMLYDCYCRAVWVDPGDANHLILGPADGVDSKGRIEESRDCGATWQSASSGLKTPWARHMVERFAQVDTELFGVLSNGALIAAPLDSLEWREVLPRDAGVNAVTAMQ